MMSRTMVMMVVVAAAVAAQCVAAVPERVSPYRYAPEDPNSRLYYSYENNLAFGGDLVGALNKTGFYGTWDAVEGGGWADFSVNGLDDKVAWQYIWADPNNPGTDFLGVQFFTAYTSDSGVVTSLAVDSAQIMWGPGDVAALDDVNEQRFYLFGDLDGDGISDVILVTTGDDILPEEPGFADDLFWAAYVSEGEAGIPFGNWWDGRGYLMFGYDGDIPLVGDINGDGLADAILYTPGDPGTVRVLFGAEDGFGGDTSNQPTADAEVQLGIPGDMLALGDVNGNGHADLILWRAHPTDDTYVLEVYLTDPIDLWDNIVDGQPDIVAEAGFPSLGDEILFARLDVEPMDVEPELTSADFVDTYNTPGGWSDDINFEIAERQSGALAPISYTDNHTAAGNDWGSQIMSDGTFGTLQLGGAAHVGGTDIHTAMVSPDYNFNKAYEVSVDFLVANNSGGYHYSAISFGSALTRDDAAGTFGIRMVQDNLAGGFGSFFQIYDGTDLVGNLLSEFDAGDWNSLQIFFTSVDGDWNPDGGDPWDGGNISVGILANDDVVWASGISGYSQNYITLEGSWDFAAFGLASHDFNNLTVVPEPATLAILGLGAVGLLRKRR